LIFYEYQNNFSQSNQSSLRSVLSNRGMTPPIDLFMEFKIFLDSDELNWCKFQTNVFKVMQTYKIEPDHYLKVLKHNLNSMNSLKNGDIVKMEGFKALDTFVLYHHTALVTGFNSLVLIIIRF
jgi:hypothetical protein